MSYAISYFYRFADFAVDLEQRVLLRDGQPVPLTPKVFDTLLVLVEQHGRIVGKNELMDRLWPDSFVVDSNLIFNIQQLRKALGDNARNPAYIETVARRGYRFIAEVEECLIETRVPSNVTVRSAQSELSTRHFVPEVTKPNGEFVNAQPKSDGTPLISEQPKRAAANEISLVRSPLMVAAAATSVLLVALSAWYLTRSTEKENKARGIGALTALKVEKLTDTGKNRHAVISPDGRYVAYSFEVKGQHGIWLRQLATNTGKEIVSLSERIGGLAIAPSGEYLYFIKGPPESWALYRVPLPLGGVPVKVIEKPQGSYSISPDDRQIAFVRYSPDDKQCALMIADIDGQHESALAIHNQPDRFNTPAWSPDGKKVAVAVGPSDSGGQQVRIVEFDVATGSERELPTGKWFHISRIVWLPDQSGLLIVGNRTLGQNKRLWRMNYASGEVSPMTDGLRSYVDVSVTADGGSAVAPQMAFTSNVWIGLASAPQTLKRITHAAEDFCWTPDGRIIYSSHTSINLNLWIMKPDGTEQKQLTDEGERNATPAMTADGRFIVFSSNRNGLLQIWRMELDGSNATQLTKGTGSNLPAVSPDGRSVFYNSVDDWSLWKVSIEGGEPVQLSKTHAIYPSVSPDGTRIACIGTGNEKERKLLIFSSSDGKVLQEINIGLLRLSAHRLRWSPDGRALLFAASRAGVTGIYRQSLSAGAAERIVEFDEDDIYDFGYSPDGQQLAVTRGDYQFDVVLLSELSQ